jgi:8-oxo-dGTP pyrophosphatase MutT (NUDIX family)
MRPIRIEDFQNAIRGRRPRPLGRHWRFSVLTPLVERRGELHLLYEVRSDTLRRQPGEIGFPGGKIETGESPRACAIRETAEELGVPAETISVIGELDPIYTYSSDTLYNFLGTLEDGSFHMTPANPQEVKELFLAPVAFFLEQEPEVYQFPVRPDVSPAFPYEKLGLAGGYRWREGRATVPVYFYEGRAIWGMTARLTWNLMDILKESLEQ